jgi:phosphoribosyl 1,2-cyclic phosphodiesterase
MNVYSTLETFISLFGPKTPYRAKVVIPGQIFEIGSFQILAFRTKHDAVNPVGFFIRDEDTNETLLFATDTRDLEGVKLSQDIDILALECNYDNAFLTKEEWEGNIDKTTAERIRENHMGTDNFEYFVSTLFHPPKKIYVLHHSSRNIDIEQFVFGVLKFKMQVKSTLIFFQDGAEKWV